MTFQIFFYPTLEVTGSIHVFECDTDDASYAYSRWAFNHPNGISYFSRESNEKESGWILYKDDTSKIASATPSLRDKFEGRKAKKNNH